MGNQFQGLLHCRQLCYKATTSSMCSGDSPNKQACKERRVTTQRWTHTFPTNTTDTLLLWLRHRCS